MALVVEDGSVVSGANSYISLAGAQAFIDARAISATLTEGLLLRAMDELNAVTFKGSKAAATNPLPFPRKDLDDCEGNDIATDTVPDNIKNAQVWLAYYIEQGSDPSVVSTPAIKMEKVDVIEVEYAVGDSAVSSVSLMSLPNVRNALKCFVAPAGRIYRA